jgi:hypothetical protein
MGMGRKYTELPAIAQQRRVRIGRLRRRTMRRAQGLMRRRHSRPEFGADVPKNGLRLRCRERIRGGLLPGP